jgi:hypothetical protein
LIWAAAVVTVVRYAAAFIASDVGEITGWLSETITVLMGLSGLGMGILDVIGGTYLFDGWRRAMPANGKAWSSRFKVLTGFVFMLMATGVMILVPFTESRVTHSSMESVLGSGYELTWWALLVNLAPYLLIGGVSVGNQVVSVSSQNVPESSPKLPEDENELSEKVRSDWRKVRPYLTDDEVLAIARMSTAEIRAKYYLKTAKTAQNWRKRAQAEVEAKVQP